MTTVDTDFDCPICGYALIATTDAPQREGELWLCDGDALTCAGGCGFAGWVGCDAETEPEACWDDEDPRNVAAQVRYDRGESERR